MVRTIIVDIVQSHAEDFKRANKVQGVHVVVESEEDPDGLCICALFTNCTHCVGIGRLLLVFFEEAILTVGSCSCQS